MPAQKIVPNIWCSRNAEEAGRFYASVFTGATSVVEARYPETGLPEFQREFAGAPQVVAVEIPGPEQHGDATRLVLINAGDEFSPNHAISFIVNFDPVMFDGDERAARAMLGAIWRELADGGFEMMPLGEYPHSKRYGWVRDRYGVHWQLMLTDPAGEPRPFIVPALMFGSDAQNRARSAVQRYVDVFGADGDAAAGTFVPYPAPQGPAKAGSTLFSDFRVGGQWFAAMDSASEQAESFTSGVSLEVRCADQVEIDRLWHALSAVPVAEQCGWLVDEFGVSWQIVPENIGELMQRPNAHEHLLGMTKIIIDEL